MQIYLPIAEVSVSALLLLAIGGMVGLLSGMFGVGAFAAAPSTSRWAWCCSPAA
jgi:hypothetical protein